MCWHQRIVFSCNHYKWGPEVSPCAFQKLYMGGEWSEHCETMNSHPLHSLIVQSLCKKCERKKAKLEGAMSRMKLLMKELNESLSKLKREEKREGREISPVNPGALWIPVSPIEAAHEKWICSPLILDPKAHLLRDENSGDIMKNVQEKK
jgi:hypothetical protein